MSGLSDLSIFAQLSDIALRHQGIPAYPEEDAATSLWMTGIADQSDADVMYLLRDMGEWFSLCIKSRRIYPFLQHFDANLIRQHAVKIQAVQHKAPDPGWVEAHLSCVTGLLNFYVEVADVMRPGRSLN